MLLLMAEILHQLRLVVPIIYRVSYIPGGCLGFQPSTICRLITNSSLAEADVLGDTKVVDRSAVDRAYDSLGKPGKPQAFPGSEDRTVPWSGCAGSFFFDDFLFLKFHNLIQMLGIIYASESFP